MKNGKTLANRVRSLEKQVAWLKKQVSESSARRVRMCRPVPFEKLSLSDAVMMCLHESQESMRASDLRALLVKKGYEAGKLGRYGNYLQTVLCRLIKRGEVLRIGNREFVENV